MLSKLFGMFSKKGCEHFDQIQDVTPDSPDSCLTCIEMGGTWVNLRLCLTCGHVGCCDNSKNKHASKHARETEHPVIQSYQPSEKWRYCFPHDRSLPDADRPIRS